MAWDWGTTGTVAVGAVAAIAGGWIGGHFGAERQADLAAGVAKQIRRAERNESAAEALLLLVVEAQACLLRYDSVVGGPEIPHASGYPVDERLEDLAHEWSRQEGRIRDEKLLEAFRGANLSYHKEQWAELHGRDAAGPGVAMLIQGVLDELRAAIEATLAGD